MGYQERNAAVFDRLAEDGWIYARPISHETYEAAKRGEWDVILTPTRPVPHAWFGDLNGKKILGLASGGGQQMPVFAALGAECTVLDYSEKQLESERMVAKREGYEIRTVRADMSKPLPFADEAFDLIFHPVSNCFIREVRPLWRECYRILKPGGQLLAGLGNIIPYLVEGERKEIVNSLPFDPVADEALRARLEAAGEPMEFSHTLEEQIGGQLEAGFTLLSLYEDTDGGSWLQEMNIPAFLATRSAKQGRDNG